MRNDLNSWTSFGEMAREEFWIVLRSFFAPIYGTFIVLRHLLQETSRVDRGVPSVAVSMVEVSKPQWTIPAE